jgi:hypothetical protein
MSIITQDQDDNTGPMAFGIYCDQVMGDAVQTNDKLRSENASLQVARTFLHSFQLFHGTTVLKEGNLLEIHSRTTGSRENDDNDADTDDDTHFCFRLDDPTSIPIEQVYQLTTEVSGIDCSCHQSTRSKTPELNVVHETGTIEMEYFISDFCSFTGTIQNQSGTLEQVQDMIRDNRHALFFMFLGSVPLEARTGQPDRTRSAFHHLNEDTLGGASFSVDTIKIAKKAVHSIMALESLGEDEYDGNVNDTTDDQEGSELELLSSVTPNRNDLGLVADQRKELQSHNAALKLSRELLQSFVVSYPLGVSGSSSLHLKLENGTRSTGGTNGNVPTWLLKVPQEQADSMSLPLSSIARLQMHLSHFPWSNPLGPLYVAQPGFTRDPALMLQYNHAVTAFFVFDESIGSIDLETRPIPGGLYNYIHHKLISSAHNMTTNYDGPDLPNLTMRLYGLEIRLDAIQKHLDALGINYEEEEEEH